MEGIKFWRIQWGQVFWPKGHWDVKLRFSISDLSLLKPDVSIRKAALKLWINLIKFLEKNSYAENYQTLDSPGVRPCKLEPENIKDWNWCQSHPQHKDYRCNQRRNSSQNLCDLKSSRALETAAKYPRPETSHPRASSSPVLSVAQKLVLSPVCGRKAFWHPLQKLGCFIWFWFVVFFLNIKTSQHLAEGIVGFFTVTPGEKDIYHLPTSKWEVHFLTAGVPWGCN